MSKDKSCFSKFTFCFLQEIFYIINRNFMGTIDKFDISNGQYREPTLKIHKWFFNVSCQFPEFSIHRQTVASQHFNMATTYQAFKNIWRCYFSQKATSNCHMFQTGNLLWHILLPLGGVIVRKLNQQTFASQFKSHWVPPYICLCATSKQKTW